MFLKTFADVCLQKSFWCSRVYPFLSCDLGVKCSQSHLLILYCWYVLFVLAEFFVFYLQDTVLAELLPIHKEHIVGYHEHDSLLDHKEEEELTEEERKAAWAEYEAEKKVGG